MATSGTQFPTYDTQFLDSTGSLPIVAAGYSLFTYVSGTTTLQATYSDDDLTVINPNPIVLDSQGRCVIFADPSLTFTLALKNPAGTTVRTWNEVRPVALPFSGTYLQTTGGTMTGFITLHANPTANLHAATKKYVDDAVAAGVASATAAAATATAAAAAATAAASGIKDGNFVLAVSSGSAVTMDVPVKAGTYQMTLETHVRRNDSGSSTYNDTTTQSATFNGTTVNTSIQVTRQGGSGYGRTGTQTGMTVSDTTVATDGTLTMSIGAMVLNGNTPVGAKLTLQRKT